MGHWMASSVKSRIRKRSGCEVGVLEVVVLTLTR